ncbi:unnamed protein product, partial [Ectocarpus sp. 4 AP-2014]
GRHVPGGKRLGREHHGRVREQHNHGRTSPGAAPDRDSEVPPQPAHRHLVHGLHVGSCLRAQPGSAHVRRAENPSLHGH